MKEYLKQLLIRTPFENPAKKIQLLFERSQRKNHPELHEINVEPKRIEKFMESVITDYFNCLDIGAHLGSTLSEIFRLSPHGHHMAFEAIPYKVSWLKNKFPEADVRALALSDKKGETIFYINKKSSGFSSLQKHYKRKDDTLLELTVQCDTLDNIIDCQYKIDFIKIDVEGGELAVFRGAVNTLFRNNPIILFECTHSGLSAFGYTSKQVFDFLTQHSYSIFLVKDFLSNGNPLRFDEFDKSMQYPFQAFNFVAAKVV